MTLPRRFQVARLAYVSIVLIATLTELEFSPDLAAAAERLVRALTPSLGWRDAIDGLRNAVLFAGLGAVWVVTSISGNARAEIKRATLVGLGLSAVVEGLQLFSPVRTASLVDVTTNTLGALGGALSLVLCIVAVRRAKGRRSYLGIPTFLLAGAYAGAALCEALTPLFRSAPIPGLQGGPLERLNGALQLAVPLSLSEVPPFDIVLFAAAGFLGVMALAERAREHETTYAWPVVAIMGAAVALAAELMHGAFGLPIRFEAAGTRALALTLGAWVAHRRLASLTQALRGSARPRAAIVGYIALLFLWGWRPLVPETDGSVIASQLTATHLVPLWSLAERVDVFSALHVAQQFLLYLPLGSMLAVWPLRLHGRWAHLKPGVWVVALIETGHILIVERTFDVTNALIAAAGLGVGWIVVRRAGFAPYGAVLGPRGAPSFR